MKKLCFALLSFLLLSCSHQSTSSTPEQVVDQVLMSRCSIRQYTSQSVGRDTLEQIALLGTRAPNGRNLQSYEVRIVDNPEFLQALFDAVRHDDPQAVEGESSLFFGAPCVIFIANDTSYDMSQVDCGLLGENMIIKAWSMGLGTCCAAHPVRLIKNSPSCAPLIEKLGFSNGFNLLYSIAIGYPAEHPDPRPRNFERVRFVD